MPRMEDVPIWTVSRPRHNRSPMPDPANPTHAEAVALAAPGSRFPGMEAVQGKFADPRTSGCPNPIRLTEGN